MTMKSIYYYLVFLFLFFALLTAGCVNITLPKDDALKDNNDKEEIPVEPPSDPDTPPPLPD